MRVEGSTRKHASGVAPIRRSVLTPPAPLLLRLPYCRSVAAYPRGPLGRKLLAVADAPMGLSAYGVGAAALDGMMALASDAAPAATIHTNRRMLMR